MLYSQVKRTPSTRCDFVGVERRAIRSTDHLPYLNNKAGEQCSYSTTELCLTIIRDTNAHKDCCEIQGEVRTAQVELTTKP